MRRRRPAAYQFQREAPVSQRRARRRVLAADNPAAGGEDGVVVEWVRNTVRRVVVQQFDIRQVDQALALAIEFGQSGEAEGRKLRLLLIRIEFQLAGRRLEAVAFWRARRGGAFQIECLDFRGVLRRHRETHPAVGAGVQTFLGDAARLVVLDHRLVPKAGRVLPLLAHDVAEAEALAQFDPDPAVRLGLARRLDHFVDPDDPAVLAGTADFTLFDAGRDGQHIVGKGAGLVLEQIDVHQQVERGERLARAFLAGCGCGAC